MNQQVHFQRKVNPHKKVSHFISRQQTDDHNLFIIFLLDTNTMHYNSRCIMIDDRDFIILYNTKLLRCNIHSTFDNVEQFA